MTARQGFYLALVGLLTMVLCAVVGFSFPDLGTDSILVPLGVAGYVVTMVGLVAPDSPEHKALAKFAENEIKKKLSAKRASIVHLDWWPDDLVPSHIKGKLYKARGSLKEESLRMSEADILAIAEEIRAQSSEFVGLIAEITPNQLLKLNLTGAALKDHGPKDS